MAISSLIVYQPLDSFMEEKDYWSSYVSFYEQYWGGPTSPYGVWFGQEYENFRRAFSEYLDIEEEEIKDCYFMKDEKGKYYVCPFSSSTKSYILSSENYVPLNWFLLFTDEEREYFFTPWGFAGINYDTKINLAFDRLEEADSILNRAFNKVEQAGLKLPFSHELGEIRTGIAGLKNWLSGFDPSGYLVLNYGEISSYIHPYTLKNERSVNDIWQMLSLLREGRVEEAHSLLIVLNEKWEDIRRKASGEIEKLTVQ